MNASEAFARAAQCERLAEATVNPIERRVFWHIRQLWNDLAREAQTRPEEMLSPDWRDVARLHDKIVVSGEPVKRSRFAPRAAI
jgi:hypothetical protein